MRLTARVRLITILSATLEIYDFTLFIFLAPAITSHFFPAFSGLGSVMPALVLFFSGYLARFIGGLFYGHCGDTKGRKPYYLNSMLVMSMSTLGIALTPGFNILGYAAPATLTLFRILQGLSLGGEVPGSLIYAAEFSKPGKRGLVTGIIVSGLMLGNILASAAVSMDYQIFGEQAVNEWAWRLPFAFGSALGIISFCLRYALDETPVYKAMSFQKKQKKPILFLLKTCKTSLVRGVTIAAVPASIIAVLFYMPRYYSEHLHLSNSISLPLIFIIVAFMGLVFATLSDQLGRVPFIRCSSAIVFFLAPYSAYLIINGSMSTAIGVFPMVLALAMIQGVYEASLIELFSTENRYSGVAFCHNLAFCFFGGATPMVLEYLCHHDWLLAPGIIPATVGCLLFFLSLRWQDNFMTTLKNI